MWIIGPTVGDQSTILMSAELKMPDAQLELLSLELGWSEGNVGFITIYKNHWIG
jgi:hypothetical protein